MKRYVLVVSASLVLGVLIASTTSVLGEKRVEALVKQANGEMRSLATALFDYNTALVRAAEEGVFPQNLPQQPGPDLSVNTDGFRAGRVDVLFSTLQSQAQIVSSFPDDPFDPEGKSYRFAGNGSIFCLVSVGPNGKLDIPWDSFTEVFQSELSGTPSGNLGVLGCDACATVSEALRFGAFVYSPTNGAFSDGDLIRFVR
jgi:hypothetical protein